MVEEVSNVLRILRETLDALEAKVVQYENLVPVLKSSDGKKQIKELINNVKKQIELTKKQTKIQLDLMKMSEITDKYELKINKLIKNNCK